MKRARRVPFVLFVVCLVAAMPFAWGAGGLKGHDLAPVHLTVTICHHPPEPPPISWTPVIASNV